MLCKAQNKRAHFVNRHELFMLVELSPFIQNVKLRRKIISQSLKLSFRIDKHFLPLIFKTLWTLMLSPFSRSTLNFQKGPIKIFTIVKPFK